MSVTCAPPTGAGPFKVTTADAEVPATTVEGVTVRVLIDVAVFEEPPPVPDPPPVPLLATALPLADAVVPVPQPMAVESRRNTLAVSAMLRS